ncbi:MAG: GIY-YIG nuclease family protein, partial [Lentisphaeria bacterium]
MAVRKKTIELLLLDGTVIGCIKYTLKGWIGVAYKIPRTELKNYEKREQLNYSGVYFLFGKNDEDNKNVVYVGQACSRKNGKGVLNRLQEHTRNPEKDYWSEAIIITTSNNSFGPTEISFLENYFTTLAIKANRYRVKNGNEPPLGNLTEEKECELEEFADYVKIAVGVLGHKVFIPLSEPPLDSKDGNKEETLLFLKRSTANAIGRCTSDGFVVLKGSKIVENPTRSCPKFVKDFRKKNQ